MNKSLVSMAIALALVAGSAHAERSAQRHSFTADKTRTNAKGTFTKHTEQNVTDNGFTRDSVRTNPNGQTATHHVGVVNDAENKTHTRDVSGTTYNGKAYSGESVTQKTDNGYTRNGEFTGPNGKTSSRDVSASIDKSTNTLTKDITKTGPNGQTSSTTVVKTYGQNDGGAE